MEQRPTKKQKELLNFIDGFIKGSGYGPSYREIMRALDYKSVSTVATHVNGLIARGWLVKKDNAARTLEVKIPGARSVATNTTTDKGQAEHVIKTKIDQLKKENIEANAEQIDTLIKAMEILGISQNGGTELI